MRLAVNLSDTSHLTLKREFGVTMVCACVRLRVIASDSMYYRYIA